ncbi:MAG TPA: anaerobic ribonucleoside-triphosphate reductase activating protein [Syntrophomonas sp.]|jgi:pyruvate formate lyase activating enzyme|nr:anaerobic ribonucleoside-triphosphate reductase activating protein [Syntrophomonas sp.]
MRFAGFLKQSLVDYPGKIAAVLFTRGCNLRCPYCHNGHLLVKPGRTENNDLDLDILLGFLQERAGFLDGVVITGGEPTLNPGLPEACQAIKALGYLVKLDTNGTRYEVLKSLIEGGLVDYVAMDLKAPLEYKDYLEVCGRLSREDFLNIRNSVHLLKEAPIEVEFRTTVVPLYHNADDLLQIGSAIAGAELYTLQQFNPRQTLEPGLRSSRPYRPQELQEMAARLRPLVARVRVVNA